MTIERETKANSTIINLDNITHIDMKRESNTCLITYPSGNRLILSGKELAQLIKDLNHYNQQLLVNLSGETEL